MTEINLSSKLTLAELVRRQDPTGRQAQIIDVLNQTNAITPDATWIPCNNGTYHEDTRTAAEPTGDERGYDMGVASEAGITEKVTEPTCMLCGLSEVDVKKVQHTPEGAAASRQVEDGFFFRGMAKTFVSRLFTGNRASSPLQINGIDNRSDYNALASDYVYDNANGAASATANKTSIYCIQWGQKMVNLLYPRNDAPGAVGTNSPIKMDDYGEQMITDANASAKKYPAYQTWFEINFGIFIHDPRCIRRIVNISTSGIDGVDDFSFDENMLIELESELEYNGDGAVLYCNRTLFAQMRKRANEKGNALFTMDREGEGPFAKKVLQFDGIPIRRCDQIANTGAKIS